MCRLSERFSTTATVITMCVPFPDLITARSLLLLQEMRAANESKLTAAIALLSTTSTVVPGHSSCSDPSCRGEQSGGCVDNSSHGRPKGHKKNKPKGKKTVAIASTTHPRDPPLVHGSVSTPRSTPGRLGPLRGVHLVVLVSSMLLRD